MLLYIGIYTLLASMAFVERYNGSNTILVKTVTLALVLFVGTREMVGCDFPTYMFQYEAAQFYGLSISFNEIFVQDELGFWLLKYVLLALNLDYVWLNVFCAVVFFIGAYRLSIKSNFPFAILAMLFPVLVIQLSMSGVRQATASGFLMLGFVSFLNKNAVNTFIFILMGFLFHSSIIIFAPIAFIVNREVKIRYLLMALVISLPVIYFLFSSRLSVYQYRYGDDQIKSFGAIYRVGLTLIPSLGIYVYRKRLSNFLSNFHQFRILLGLFSLNLIPMYFFSTIAAHRLNYYFIPSSVLLLTHLSYTLDKNRRFPLFLFGSLFMYGMYCLVWFSTSRHATKCYVPYDSYIF